MKFLHQSRLGETVCLTCFCSPSTYYCPCVIKLWVKSAHSKWPLGEKGFFWKQNPNILAKGQKPRPPQHHCPEKVSFRTRYVRTAVQVALYSQFWISQFEGIDDTRGWRLGGGAGSGPRVSARGCRPEGVGPRVSARGCRPEGVGPRVSSAPRGLQNPKEWIKALPGCIDVVQRHFSSWSSFYFLVLSGCKVCSGP